jgi:hypothetical protein
MSFARAKAGGLVYLTRFPQLLDSRLRVPSGPRAATHQEISGSPLVLAEFSPGRFLVIRPWSHAATEHTDIFMHLVNPRSKTIGNPGQDHAKPKLILP